MTIPLTREQYDAAKQRLQAEHGVILDGDSGEVGHNGIVLLYAYHGAELTISVTHHPFMKPVFAIEREINNWFKEILK